MTRQQSLSKNGSNPQKISYRDNYGYVFRFNQPSDPLVSRLSIYYKIERISLSLNFMATYRKCSLRIRKNEIKDIAVIMIQGFVVNIKLLCKNFPKKKNRNQNSNNQLVLFFRFWFFKKDLKLI